MSRAIPPRDVELEGEQAFRGRVARRALAGVVLALGAPLGWLLIRMIDGVDPITELSDNLGLYLYLLIPTALVLSGFGAVLGRHEEVVHRANARLSALSITDELTGLRNGRYFHARLFEEWAESARSGRPLALVVVDIDHFKRINDTYGHPTGDTVLQGVGRAIAQTAREGETAARVGGEEFAILLPATGAPAARLVADRLLEAVPLATASLDARGRLRVEVSAGVAGTDVVGLLPPHELYSVADAALYQAKRLGRGRVEMATGPVSETET